MMYCTRKRDCVDRSYPSVDNSLGCTDACKKQDCANVVDFMEELPYESDFFLKRLLPDKVLWTLKNMISYLNCIESKFAKEIIYSIGFRIHNLVNLTNFCLKNMKNSN